MDIDRERLEHLKEIMSIDFSLVELNLYLDTHPMDQRALNLHNEYVMKYKCMKEMYEKEHGPLTHYIESDCPWEWIEESWPWEIDNEMGGK
ncbi:MAG: spore coat protein CotJB [Caulobacteraceae bacterium]